MIPRRRAHIAPGEFTDIPRWVHSDAAKDMGLVSAWEQAAASHVGVPQTAAISSGRLGMGIIFDHLGVGSGDEVVIPAYTLRDLVPLIEKTGAMPVPADIDRETFNVTPETVGARVTSRTKAILALHAFGNPCPIEDIVERAAERGVPVIEDCAHSFGASVGGRQTGTFGFAAFFSLEPTKPINTFGGGLVASSDAALVERVRRENANGRLEYAILEKKAGAARTECFLMSTGLSLPLLYLFSYPALKARISRVYRAAQQVPPAGICYSPVQAKLGLSKLEGLDARIEARNEAAALYRSLLKPEIRVQETRSGTRSTVYFFVAILPCPAAPVRRRLLWRGIDAAIEDEIADDCAALLGYDDCPNVRHICRHAIALPMFDGISEREVRRVATALNALV